MNTYEELLEGKKEAELKITNILKEFYAKYSKIFSDCDIEIMSAQNISGKQSIIGCKLRLTVGGF